MFLRETVERCPQCEEATPHSRRRVALPKIVATAAVLLAAWCCWIGDPEGYVGAGLLLAIALLVRLLERDKFWNVRCVRCRTKKLVELRKTKPTLDGNTEIQLF